MEMGEQVKMYRTGMGILIAVLVMLTGCGNNADSSGDVESSLTQAHSSATDSDNSTDQSGSDDRAEEEQAEDMEEESTGTEQTEETVETEQTDISEGDLTETDEEDEVETVYLKPCDTYQDILDNAYEVITHRTANIVEADELFDTSGIWEAGMGRSTDEALAAIGYMLYDVDGNGIEELIIADTSEEHSAWDNRILLMYSLQDDKPVLVIDGWARNRYHLLNDGTFYNEGSGGAAYTIFATYRMSEDGIGLEVIDYYYSGYYGDSDSESEWGWFYNTTGKQTEDKSEIIEFDDDNAAWEMMEAYMAQVKELDLTFFAELRDNP